MNSPFPYESYAAGDTFFGRDDEMDTILKYAKNSGNLVIYSKRRMGKSSLIKEALAKVKEEYLCIYADIYEITSCEDYAAILLRALADSQKGDIKTVLKSLASLFKRVRVEPSIDPNTYEYSIKPVVKALSFEEMIEDFFNGVFEISKKQKVVLAIDEFQQISTIKEKKLGAVMRKYCQQNHNVSYVFLGSKRHMLSRLFEHKAPLFEMATAMELGPIALEDVKGYVSKHLKVSSENIEYIYAICDSETKLLQHIFNILYLEYGDKSIEKEMVDLALKEILNAKSSGYRVIFDTFSQNQKKAFKLLTKYGKNLFSKEILDEQNIGKNSMQAALKQLFEKEFIDKSEDEWFVPDRAFELWGKSLS